MSGIKGFSIVTIILLCVAFFFLSVGKSEESIEDKQFKEEYNKTMIGEMDFPVMVYSRIDFTNDNESLYEELDSSYLMADLHKKRFLLFFCYNELPMETLQIDRIIVNDEYQLEFIQDDESLSDEDKSFVVFQVDPLLTKDRKNIVVTIFFKENNNLNFLRREFIIYPTYIDLAFEGIEDFYIKYSESVGEI